MLIVLDVLFKVLLHRGLVDKFFFALGVRARVGPFTRVRSDVLIEDGLLSKAFRALWTHVGLLPRMDSDMLVEYRFLSKRLNFKLKWRKIQKRFAFFEK